jgi:fatty-acyl-CoA synthase
LTALVERNAAQRPYALAFVEHERRITYAQFDLLCRGTAAWLARQGIGRGDRVAVWLVNRIEWLALLFALARLGATLVAVNTRYRAEELEYILARGGARLLVMQPRFREHDFVAVLESVPAASAPELERVVLVGSAGDPLRVAGRPAARFDAFEIDPGAVRDMAEPDAPAVLFTTSGTTKTPKLVVHSQRTLALHGERCAAAFGFHDPAAALLAAMPFCGVFGMAAFLAAFAAGAPSILMDGFDAAAATALLRLHAVTHAFGSDEMFRRLMEAAPGPNPFPAARAFGFAAFSPAATDIAREAWSRGIPLHGLYGSSEALALFAIQPAALPVEQRIEPGGRPVSDDACVRVRDIDTGELLPTGRSGELEIKAPTNFIGYLNDPPATAAAVSADGFFRTGDIGRLREDGTFVFESRRGDAIRLGGFLVSPAEIEEVLKRVAGIEDAQVVAVEIERQTRAAAFVIPAHGAEMREADVIAAAAARMAGFKVPARVWAVDHFPTTPSANGTKIQRAALRAMAAERLAREGSA